MNSRELIRDVQQAALENFAGSIFPIYRFSEGADPIHVGTCFAFEYKQRHFLVTAAHVIDHKTLGCLSFASTSGNRPIEIKGKWHIVNPGDRPRDDDPYDFAWHELTPDEVLRVPCIPASEIEDTDSPSIGVRFLTMIGFPVSKNKKLSPESRRKRTLNPVRAQYTDMEIRATDYFDRRGISSKTHVAMKRTDRSIDSNGVEENTIGHRGFSGGPLIHLGLTHSPASTSSQKVVGVVLEGDDSMATIVALRLSVLLRNIDYQISREEQPSKLIASGDI